MRQTNLPKVNPILNNDDDAVFFDFPSDDANIFDTNCENKGYPKISRTSFKNLNLDINTTI